MDPISPTPHAAPSSALPDPNGFSREQRRTLALLRAGLVLGVALPLLLFCIVAGVRYHQVRRDAQANAERMVRMVAEHALKLFDTSEVLLDRLEDIVHDQSDAQVAANEAQLHAKLTELAGGLPQVQSLWVVDAHGHPLLSNRYLPAPRELDLSDRESFVAHQAGYSGVFVTSALVGKKTRDVFFDLSRRRGGPGGTFAGTVQVSLYPKYLVDFYREVAARELDTTIGLTRIDGAIIARWPDAGVGARIPRSSALLRELAVGKTSGSMMLTSTVDGIERLVSYRRLAGYPLYVTVGVRRGAIVAAWAYEMLWLAMFTLTGAAALGVAFWLALRKTSRELVLANRLYAESLQRKQVEHALLHAQKMEALGHLTGGVAHDFNNLLMVIGMNAHLLRQGVPGMTGNPRLEAIQRSVSNGAKLTRQLLSFSRRQPLLPSTIDLHAELPAIVELCGPVLGKTIEVTVRVEPGTPPLCIDRAELELSLINLAINARHAMPRGGRFEVVAAPLDGAEPRVEIAVRDTGCGIAPDILPRVTEPFFSTRPTGEGTGLGLSQVNTMCQRADGSLRIDSVPGQGTTVRLRFPAAPAAQPEPQVDAPAHASFALRLLLVEDNHEIAAATQLALESLGCTVERCASADEALERLRSGGELLDAVLSDITMPGTMDGIGLARYLRQHYPALPVALMTGYAQRLADAEALHIRVLPKPFDVQGLRQVLAWLAAQMQPA